MIHKFALACLRKTKIKRVFRTTNLWFLVLFIDFENPISPGIIGVFMSEQLSILCHLLIIILIYVIFILKMHFSNRILCGHNKEWIPVNANIYAPRGHHVEWHKSVK